MRKHKRFPIYDVGTKVRLVTERKEDGVYVTVNSSMECNWFGKEVTIKEVVITTPVPCYHVIENEWIWDDSLIECVASMFCTDEDDEDLEGASFGKFFTGFAIKKWR